jgi:catechol 2,3-dioxygenase-like lactoylglutathione lyase family enzyme
MADNPLAYLGTRLEQVAYVVADFDEATEFFKTSLGIEKFYIWDHITKEQTDKIYRGGPGEFEFSAAYAYSGDMLVELCKHESGNNVYKDWMEEKGIGLHHTGYLLTNADEYLRAFEHLSNQGFEVSMAGRMKGGGKDAEPDDQKDCQWSYFDTRHIVGSYTEIYWLPPEIKPIFDKMKAGIDPFV